MRKLMILLTLIVPILAWGQTSNSKITANAENLVVGKSSPLTISLTNEGDDKYNGFQFDVFLPNGITLKKNENGLFEYQFSNRYDSNGMTASIRDLGEGWYRVICFSMSNICITGHEGSLLTLTMQAPGEWGTEEMIGKLSEVLLSRVDGFAVDCEPSEFEIKTSNTMMGDVNFDKTVNVTDVMLVVSYILGDIYPEFIFKYADMDKSGVVDVTDCMMIVDIILHKD